ncbi:putative DNA polymerase epsilon subunit b [Leptomonas pyrrhocoris]|uniref:DNA polymerase epsilon subunit n=1 Tax=Leptomonas pyrrhocoris TaxID=157538 RepID=A0A0M9GAF7_LEPPY|nr:putative DNA polymerase epsilon subunit b [Leptomonas pyrrhocoris]KPA86099.1 putative DNA polymerase epsilon subunit b [Leptomonas pyrrhocoris]|eukprot:XP_015664538.1 putative DNA polymerase epsilon subunit b [Leptomonas pyrrhocoris]
MSDVEREIQMLAKASKYDLHPSAIKRLAEFLRKYNTSDEYRRDLLRDIFSLVQKQYGSVRLIDKTKIEAAINTQENKLHGSFEVGSSSFTQVVELNRVPKVYVDDISGELISSASPVAYNRLQCLNQRYLLARRRCFRCGLFQKAIEQRLSNDDLLPLLLTSAMEGLDPSVQIAVLGLILQRDGVVYLEDLRGEIKLKFTDNSRVTNHCFVGTGCMVVVTGFWVNGALQVLRIDLPPAERREVTLRDVGTSTDLFGLAPSDLIGALTEEKRSVQNVIIVMAHVHLDKTSTMSRLARFFERMQGLSEAELRDVTFVFTGDFSSIPLHFSDASHLPDIFDSSDRLQTLLDGLGRCVTLNAPTAAQQSQFVLIPGPNDMTVLQGFQPQTPIAAHFAKGLESRIKRLTLAPNPCRLRFHTHEMIIARRDFLRDFQQGESRYEWERYRPKESTEGAVNGGAATASAASFERVTKTILDEAHLSPNIDEAVLWKMDDALRIPVLPHTMLLCDSTEQWECHYKGVHVLNPGSFAVNGTFLWYTPADGQCSLSTLE